MVKSVLPGLYSALNSPPTYLAYWPLLLSQRTRGCLAMRLMVLLMSCGGIARSFAASSFFCLSAAASAAGALASASAGASLFVAAASAGGAALADVAAASAAAGVFAPAAAGAVGAAPAAAASAAAVVGAVVAVASGMEAAVSPTAGVAASATALPPGDCAGSAAGGASGSATRAVCCAHPAVIMASKDTRPRAVLYPFCICPPYFCCAARGAA